MESINSFKGYGKVDEAQDREFRRLTRRRLAVIGLSLVLLLVIVIAAAVGIVLKRKGDESTVFSSAAPTDPLRAVCSVTLHPDSCYSSMAAAAVGADSNRTAGDPVRLFKLSLRVAIDGISNVSALPRELEKEVKDPRVKQALQVCTEFLHDSVDQLNDSLSLLNAAGSPDKILTRSEVGSFRTWLSAVLTNQETCVEAFEGTSGGYFRDKLAAALRSTTEFTSNSLAIATHVLGSLENLDVPVHRKLLSTAAGPEWVNSDSYRRRLLLAGSPDVLPDVTVAQDGTGQCKTITEALALVPVKSSKPFVIRVKAGKYMEEVLVDKSKWNVIMVGDGMYQTVVYGSKSIKSDTTIRTATFSVKGQGFMARDIGFANTAGPESQQAVALLAMADQAIFHRCSFDAYQDTLYVHSYSQFYRECEIRGTVDFIFGNAAAVFHRCAIKPRQPIGQQKNTVTAQKRSDPNGNTGIVIEDSTISALGSGVTAKTYLGRPWGSCALTVVMSSEIGGLVEPEGWLEWVPGVTPPGTLFYAEHGNSGPGSDTSRRVSWPGYRPSMTDEEAQRYGVGSFLRAKDWIPEALTT